ncbi:pilus assembly protein TadB [Altererythrobacter indicus]|uniref:Pilus assembly protein TadB n=1 Tax=Altericroceibacterium indicum TaxID=374177 RepID=A0A845AEZ5_9SPHN|nr:type II secretion system F family protein [Altericroceibacterium indicum]MXP25728.1 pilus assembly protein TadB [Altericroceibacterium indicum]
MGLLPLLLFGFGLTLLVVLVYLLAGGPSPAKESQRRLESLRARYSESTVDRVESQFKKAIASRRAKVKGGSSANSRAKALQLRLKRAGKDWTLNQYAYVSGGIALVVALLAYLQTGALFLSLLLGILFGAGIPHMVVNRLINKRLDNFIVKFPDAIDLIVRGLRAGLPVAETLMVISSEIPGPVGEEFRTVTEKMKIGRTMEEALQETANKLALPELQFFVITLAIQRETGGNLGETLANLSDVLRKRAQMKLKIRAMSSESKASAYIVGSLPFFVFIMIWFVNPNYVGGFFTDDPLIVTGLGAMIWMAIGAFIMAKMVSFEI